MQSFILWADGTHTSASHKNGLDAKAHTLRCQRSCLGGKIDPVVSFVTADGIKFVAQDYLGCWWAFTKEPVLDVQGRICFLSGECHKSGTGWWTYKVFNLEKIK